MSGSRAGGHGEHGEELHPGATRSGREEVTDRPGVTVSRDLDAPPAAVMAILTRAEAFPLWVVGPGRVVAVDPDWPGVGATFTHETGRGPLKVRDRTTLEHIDVDGGRISLHAMVRPAGRALIQLHVVPRGSGSRVTMHERPVAGLGSWVPSPIYLPLLRARNVVALARLEKVVRRAPTRTAG